MHGSLKFPSKFYVNDATEEFEEFLFKDYMETSKVALVLLVGTIQKFIINSAALPAPPDPILHKSGNPSAPAGQTRLRSAHWPKAHISETSNSPIISVL